MAKNYKRSVVFGVLLILSFVGYGQNGIVKTGRGVPRGVVIFETSKLTGIGDSRHIDGYVRKNGTSVFTFPVGNKGVYRPFAAAADGTTGAYFQENPANSSLPDSPFSTNSKDGSLKNVSTKEYWDIDGSNATKLTLTWNNASNVAELTGNNLALLTVAGWNKGTSRWENIPGVIDELALLGGQSSLSSGSITTKQSFQLDKYSIYSLAALVSEPVAANFAGTLETLSCSEVKGWVWDKNYPDGELTVELVEGNSVYAVTNANIFREDLKSNGTGTGRYGFSFNLPANLIDGTVHQLSVRVRGSSYSLEGSPKSVNCGFEGSFEVADNYNLKGWAWDKNNPSNAVTVEIYEGNAIYATVTANLARPDLAGSGIGTGNYGFNIGVPSALKDGIKHNLSVRIKGTSFVLANSPRTITAPISQYSGKFEWADCKSYSGWVWDKSYPNSAMTIELFEGNVVYATAVANAYRSDLEANQVGTGKYAFNFDLPANLKDGKAHNLSVRVKGTDFVLTNSPRTVTCAAPVRYAGRFEWADCKTLSGWAWDKDLPGTAVTVEVVEGTVIHGSTVANIYRENLKTAGYGTGNYGFSMELPATLKDGKDHQLTLRIKGTSFVLTDSPRTVNCPVPSQYAGRFEWIDCKTFSGWVWDKTLPNSALTVELVEGNTVYATTVANIYRENLKTSGYGTGNYGFAMDVPVALKDGKEHQVSVRVKGANFVLTNSPKTINCPTPVQYSGKFEWADCKTFSGWAWDKGSPNTALTLELYEGTTVYATFVADGYREDLKTNGVGTGKYAFNLELPSALKDGKAHQLSVRVKDSNFVLTGSPRSVTCSAPVQYGGRFEWIDCKTFSGWAWDKNAPNTAVIVELVEGDVVHATATANIYRENLKTAGYGTGNYGFSMAIPASLQDGRAHQVSVRIKNANFVLSNSPLSVTCSAPAQYGGRFEWVDCKTFSGWAWDKNAPNGAVTVELVEGSTVHATTVANIYRENLKTSGYGTGNYGFSMELPQTLKDGKEHQLSVRIAGTSFVLANSPKSVTCSAQVQYSGKFEWADCKTFSGWAWDKNAPNTALTLELIEGANVYSTFVADGYREDLKLNGVGTGKYAFNLELPAVLKDGKEHQLSVRIKGTNVILSNSPRAVTCSAPVQYAGRFEWIDCKTFSGWAWDKNAPNTAVIVELVEGDVVHATATANIYRENLKTAGYGTGNYGFNLALPASLKDGSQHQVSIRIKDTNFVLTNSPKAITCSSSARILQDTSSMAVKEVSPFKVQLTNENLNANNGWDLTVAPNPSKGKVTINYGLEKGAKGVLTIVNNLGSILINRNLGGDTENSGIEIDLSNQPDGSYIVYLMSNGRTTFKRLILSK